MSFKTIQSPVGELILIANESNLLAILWDREDGRVPIEKGEEDNHHPVLLNTEKQLAEYFEGKRKTFSLSLEFTGTDFQKAVWNELLKIPFGATKTYQQIANSLGNPKAVRAVGLANGKNPISIVAPCHRVIGASGKLVGYGGGLHNKAFLLDLEAKERAPQLF